MNKYLAVLALSLMVLVIGATANNTLVQTNTQKANDNSDSAINQTADNDASVSGKSYGITMDSNQVANSNIEDSQVMQNNLNNLTLTGNAVDKDDTIDLINFQDASFNSDTSVAQDNENLANLTNFGDSLDQNNKQVANDNTISTISQGNSNNAAITDADEVFAVQTNIQYANKNDDSEIDQDGDNFIDATAPADIFQLDIENANDNVRSDIEQEWEFDLDALGPITADQQTIQDANFNLDSIISQDGDDSASVSHTDVFQKDSQTANWNIFAVINQVADNSGSDQ